MEKKREQSCHKHDTVSKHMGKVSNVVLILGPGNPGGLGLWVGEGPDGQDGGNARVSLRAT